MSWQKYSIFEPLDLLKEFSSDAEKGLVEKDLPSLRAKHGFNVIKKTDLSAWTIFFRQLKSPFIYLLLIASALSFFLGETIEALMIFLFILINTLLGFFQEFRSEKTVQMLSKLISWKSLVVRSGRDQEIPSEELLPGDIVFLENGDKIGADMRLLEVQNFSVDESSLTGEALAVSKQGERLLEEACSINKAENIVFAGTSVTSGKAKAIVISIGDKTEFGKIASLMSGTKKVGGFEAGISKLSSFILKLVIVTLVSVLILNAVIKGPETNWLELTIFAIALAIGVIPEALPLVMTFSFSKGAAILAKNKVVVKRLSAIEDLGNIEILCSDKTGTLTEGRMSVAGRKAFSDNEANLVFKAFLASALATENRDPFDEAIKLEAAASSEEKEIYHILFNSPFDPNFKRNNILAEKDGEALFVVRGAWEVIAPMCPEVDLKAVQAWAEQEGKLGRRVLAVAEKMIRNLDFDNFCSSFRQEEKDLNFLGLISFADPIKDSAYSAVKKAAELGLGIKIITGDGPEVAAAISSEIGLCSGIGEVLSERDFSELSDEEKKAAIDKYKVFARFSPAKKHELISILEDKYNVAYLGDGINDAPALKAASVSLAVNNASDIARESADIILLENDLNIIIEGVKQGRVIFVNGLKYIKATLASNFGNFYAVALASLLIPYLPMLPLQILLLNLISDFPMIAIAGDNVDDEELARPRSYDTKEIIISAMSLGVISTFFDFVFFALFNRISPEVLHTNWFIASSLTELIFIFSIRSRKSIFKAKRPSKSLLYLSLGAVLVSIAIPMFYWGREIFSFVSPKPVHLFLIIGISFIYLITTETYKKVFARFKV